MFSQEATLSCASRVQGAKNASGRAVENLRALSLWPALPNLHYTQDSESGVRQVLEEPSAPHSILFSTRINVLSHWELKRNKLYF